MTGKVAGALRRVPVLAVLAGMLVALGCRSVPEGPPDVAAQRRTALQRSRYAQSEARLRSPDPAVRRQAAIALLSMDYAPALGTILENMRNAQDPAVRISTIQAAAFCEEHRAFQTVLAAIGDPSPRVQREAAIALTRFTQPEEVDAMMALIDRPTTTSRQRQLLLSAFGEALAIRAVPVLLAALRDGDEAARIAALEALRKISRRPLLRELDQWEQWWAANSHRTREDVLAEHLQAFSHELRVRTEELNEQMDEQQELMKLVSAVQSETPKMLLDGLASRHGSVRLYSSSRLAALPGEKLSGLKVEEKSYAVLKGALADDSAQVRRNVIRFVVGMENDYRDELVRKALGDEDPAVLTTAIEAVRAGTGPEAVESLEALLIESRHAQVREAAAIALGKVGSQRSVPILVAGLDDAEENVRWFAVEGLRKLGATQAVPRISELLEKDGSAQVREIAASTLGELGQPAGVPALRAALDDRSERVRQKAEAALLALATDNYERMMVIADSLQEQDLFEAAAQVLTRVIEQFGQAEDMESRLMQTYRQLAAVQKEQTDFAAAAATYEKLDEMAGGSQEVRLELVNCLLQAAEAPRIVAAVENWLANGRRADTEPLMELALKSAELLIGAGHGQEAGAVLDLVAEAAGENGDRRIAARIEQLRRRIAQ